jgi:hypothetical protein
MTTSDPKARGPESATSLLDEVRRELLAENLTDQTSTEEAPLRDLPSRVRFGEMVNELVDEILMSADAAPPELRRSVATKVDLIMTRRRQRSGLLERLLRSSRLEKRRTVSDVATSIGVDETVLAALEDGLQELRATDPQIVASWIFELEHLDAHVEAALWRSAQTTALPQAELAMAGEEDRPKLATSDTFVKGVIERLRELAQTKNA